MKKYQFMLALCFTTTLSISCEMPSDEKNVCEFIMCNPVGLLIPESRSKCLSVNRTFAIYLATLGFLRDPPSCKTRDQQCNIVGTIEQGETVDATFCETNLEHQVHIDACLASIGLATDEYCDSFTGTQRDLCFASQTDGG